MELLFLLECLWQLEREHAKPKQEQPEQSESEEPSEVRYPSGYPPVLAAS
jgi:hypothetical protein